MAIQVAERGPASSGPAEEFPLEKAEFDFIAQLVHARTGIVLGAHKRAMVYSRLTRRLRSLGCQSFPAYCNLLRSSAGADEIEALINAVTTNLTRFFREQHHFEHLRETALPDVLARKRRRLRIWSSACSTGEEPYSIAMTVASAGRALAGWDTRILATDLDTNVLATGRSGRYGDGSVADLPASYRNYLSPADRGLWQIDPMLRSMIAFKQLNLLGSWAMKGPFDAIFCRNVMIYFDGPTKTRLVTRLIELLAPGGWLYIGHSESLLDQPHNIKLEGRTIYRKVEHGG